MFIADIVHFVLVTKNLYLININIRQQYVHCSDSEVTKALVLWKPEKTTVRQTHPPEII